MKLVGFLLKVHAEVEIVYFYSLLRLQSLSYTFLNSLFDISLLNEYDQPIMVKTWF